jgi:hypothetical protein
MFRFESHQIHDVLEPVVLHMPRHLQLLNLDHEVLTFLLQELFQVLNLFRLGLNKTETTQKDSPSIVAAIAMFGQLCNNTSATCLRVRG